MEKNAAASSFFPYPAILEAGDRRNFLPHLPLQSF
jgi:hypothetical protein